MAARGKAFVGPRLRRLRRERGQTQAEMARDLGVSAAYVNLLENNQRSLSLPLLMRLSKGYGVDWRDLVAEEAPGLLADLRAVFEDPFFAAEKPDLQELRAAVSHSPALARALVRLHRSHGTLLDRILALGAGAAGAAEAGGLVPSPERAVHDLFRRHRNHFPALEAAAERLRAELPFASDEAYAALRGRLRDRHGIAVRLVPVEEMPDTLRDHDEAARLVRLSEALDHTNRVFQLAHVLGLVEFGAGIEAIADGAGVESARDRARCRVELANYLAAAILMPYAPFLEAARRFAYDLDRLAQRFDVSFEQVCHRVTTLQRDGARGVPFFFLRIDKAGNVTKRFNATDFQLADHGGACPRWDIHTSFRTPGRILPQVVEMPDGARFFTVSRTVDRPVLSRLAGDNRLAVTLGCALEHASDLVYAAGLRLGDRDLATPIGINCRLCPRQHCAQRAQQPIHFDLTIDVRRRGQTRFES